jgi:hypothetical protein
MHSKDLMLKSKPKPLRGGGGAKEETQKPKELLEGKSDKLENVFDVEPCHDGKIKFHN